MSGGRYLDPPPTFAGENSRRALRQRLRDLRRYHAELDRIVRRHGGYRTDGYWWALTRRARIGDEIEAVRRRLRDLAQRLS